MIKLLSTVFNKENIPSDDKPDIVLAGRSNVGKSSFVNCLFNSKIARTSSTPGKTRSINIYDVDNLYNIVDLPGFGYARVGKAERIKWAELIDDYFSIRKNIVFAFHIVDSRVEIPESDIFLQEYLNSKGVPFSIILNKTDKLNQSEKAKSLNRIRGYINAGGKEIRVIPFSAVKGIGKKEVFSTIHGILNA